MAGMTADLFPHLLRAGALVAEGINSAVLEAGFEGLRPAHGLAFVRLARHGATASELAEHLGITKQSAAALVGELVERGYVTRTNHPTDGRARLLVLSDRGRAATRAAEAAAEAISQSWADALGRERYTQLVADLARMGSGARLRPVW